MGLEGRLRLEWISSAEAQKFVKVMTEFTEEIRALGPNPLGRYHFAPGQPGKEFLACPSATTGPMVATGVFSQKTQKVAAGG